MSGAHQDSGGGWLSVEDAAAYLGVTVRTMQRRIETGAVPVTRRGRTRYLHRADLDKLRRARGDEGEWLTIEEVAAYLGLAITTTYRRVGDGIFPTMRRGRTRYVSRAVLDDYLAACRIEPGDLDHLRVNPLHQRHR